ncbi:hypothetical protein AAG570_003720 [Ranatra chinensis]|uniref:Vacuolar protein sorting-associated protein 11 homolog n=1 Tax=Ranatra chinensis TaxID=642074 RepID=A0ABD0Y4I4_9HEMI
MFQGVRVTASSSGHELFVLGDSDGYVHLVNRTFEIRSFSAYERGISLLHQSKDSPILVSIGEDEIGVNPVIKVWNLDKNDKHGDPVCLRITRATIPNKAVIASCLAVSDNLSLMAVGFVDGSIIIYRGDISRERSSKQKHLKDDLPSITGLAFQTSGKVIMLYVATVSSVEVYDVTHKDKEKKIHLDGKGCALRCSILAESLPNNDFMVARRDAVYCYTNFVLGPCYAISGEKIQLEWFRSYLVIVAKDMEPAPRISTRVNFFSDLNRDSHIITILDIQNKFIVFTALVKDVSAVLIEWGAIYVLSTDNSLCLIAKSQQYDAQGLMEIFRQFGDHLYIKGDHKGAMEQYIKTIGSLEPSYVIRKYKDSQQVENLTTYLQALHKDGVATGDHTTLLINCYTKLNKPELLKEFVMTKDREVDFNVEVAIEVCRHVSAEDALLLAEKHCLHSWYLTIQIEDQKKYNAALDYIGKLDFEQAEFMIKKYGITLLENVPEETTSFLKKLCTDYEPNNKNSDGSSYSGQQKANPEDFIHYFLNNSERLVEFLEHLIQISSKWSPHIYTTLLEHYIHVWGKQTDHHARLQYEQKIMRLLESPDASYDKLQALILCKAANFKSGILHLYEQNKMYQAILKYHVAQQDYSSLLVCCRRFGHQEPGLWVQALWAVAPQQNLPHDLLDEILSVIEKEKLLSPLSVVDALSYSPNVKVGNVKNYLNKIFQTELKLTEQQKALIEKYTQQTKKSRNTIEGIRNKCSACNKQLELPSVNLFCQHSYHQHCFQTFSENECPMCLPNNKQILDAIQSQEQSKDLHEVFHSQLDRADDAFSLVTAYLGRRVFTELTDYSKVAMGKFFLIVIMDSS